MIHVSAYDPGVGLWSRYVGLGTRAGPGVQVCACGSGVGLCFKPGPSACSLPLMLYYFGCFNNGHMTEP